MSDTPQIQEQVSLSSNSSGKMRLECSEMHLALLMRVLVAARYQCSDLQVVVHGTEKMPNSIVAISVAGGTFRELRDLIKRQLRLAGAAVEESELSGSSGEAVQFRVTNFSL
ncbi:MAG: hypothetical protein LBV45_06520 [Xanthomonadaceae bacterium]|nr:hypothetical protein [Xanthomonadaceae bacterium]